MRSVWWPIRVLCLLLLAYGIGSALDRFGGPAIEASHALAPAGEVAPASDPPPTSQPGPSSTPLDESSLPAEVQAVLAGHRLIERTTDQLSNVCADLVPISPMLHTPRLRSAPIDPDEAAHAWRYGFRIVVPKAACADRDLPSSVVLRRPIAPGDLALSTGRPGKKTVVHVNGSLRRCADGAAPPCCVSADLGWRTPANDARRLDARSRIADPATPACDLQTAVRAWCLRADQGTGDVVVSIAGGDYVVGDTLQLCRGMVLSPRDDATVRVTGLVDLNAPGELDGPWVPVDDPALDPSDELWVAAWSRHRAGLGSVGTQIPMVMDGVELRPILHFDGRTRSPDWHHTTLYDHPGDGFFWADPKQGITSKSPMPYRTAYDCGKKDPRVRAGTPCDLDYASIPRRKPMDLVLEKLCRPLLGDGIDRCIVLKLADGSAPGDHDLRSIHTTSHLSVANSSTWSRRTRREGVLIRGLRLDHMYVGAVGIDRKLLTSPDGYVFRAEGLWLDHASLTLAGEDRMEVADSWFLRSYLNVGGPGLQEVAVRNNFIERAYGKPIRLASRPLPLGKRLVAHHWSVSQDGYNHLVFNTLWHSAGVNATSVHGWLIRYNHFQNGGSQEGILDGTDEFRFSLVHHNWCADCKGRVLYFGPTFSRAVMVEGVEVSDNQAIRSPCGAGTGLDDRKPGECDGTPWGLELYDSWPPSTRPFAVCRDVLIENNLFAMPGHGGISAEVCDDLTIRNTTVAGAGRIGIMMLGNGSATRGARVIDNVSVGTRGQHVDYSEYPSAGGAAPVIDTMSGNWFGSCDAARYGTRCQQEGFPSVGPVFNDPSREDWRIVNATHACSTRPGARFSHAGFNYLTERCGVATPAPIPGEGPRYGGNRVDAIFEVLRAVRAGTWHPR